MLQRRQISFRGFMRFIACSWSCEWGRLVFLLRISAKSLITARVRMPGRGREEMMEAQDRRGEVATEFPVLIREDARAERVVEVQPAGGGGGFAEEGVVLEGEGWVGREAVWSCQL